MTDDNSLLSGVRRRMKTTRLFDIPLRNITLDQAVRTIRECLRLQEPSAVYFVNAHCVNVAQDDREYFKILQSGAHVFADGVGMRIAARLAGRPLVDNVNGTDLFPRLCGDLEGTGTRVYLLGARPGVACRLKELVRQQYPGLVVCGVHDGYFGETDEAALLDDIRRCKTDLLLVAMGVPRQEKWIAQNLAAVGARVAIGVGALFDFYSGRLQRSPVWMRRLGLEWLGRLIQEPRRLWKRYLLGNFRFLWLALVQTARERRGHRSWVRT